MLVRSVILAAGQGTRMKSALPKVLHPLLGKPLVAYSVETATAVTGNTPVLVIGHGSEQVRAALDGRVEFVVQDRQLGTGHAVMAAQALLQGRADAILVTYGDMPLLTEGTLRRMVESHTHGDSVITMLALVAGDPRGFGRVVRGAASTLATEWDARRVRAMMRSRGRISGGLSRSCISTAQLNTLRCVHLPPIELVVFQCTYLHA